MTAETHPVERKQLMGYVDGELAADVAARVATHLTECAECRQWEADLRSVSAQMLSWNVEPAPSQISESVLTALQANPPQGAVKETRDLAIELAFGRRMRPGGWILAAACLGVAAMILVKVFDPSVFSTFSVERGEILATRSHLDASDRLRMPAGGGGGGIHDEKSKAMPSPRTDIIAGSPAKTAASMVENLVPTAPMIARTASLKISVKDFQSARAGVDRIIQSFHGFAASMTINSAAGEPQSLNAELQIPSAQCDAALAALKSLGRVEQEQQGGEEVTAQVVDLDARLKNARETETRLQDILKTRTGKVSDVLEVEKEIADTRESIERMEGEQKQLHNRITFSAITLDLHEEYQASLESNAPSAGRRIRNAVVDGFRAAAEGSLALLVFLLNAGPSLLLAAVILFWPARWAWRRLHRPASGNAAIS
jgi:hypothetical protein